MSPRLLSRSLLTIVVLEALVISGLIIEHVRITIRSGIHADVPPEIANPLYGALEYSSPPSKFEDLIKQHPQWISFIPPGATNSILALCAESRQTNYIRILIANGANVEAAIREEKAKHNLKAINLLKRNLAESKQ